MHSATPLKDRRGNPAVSTRVTDGGRLPATLVELLRSQSEALTDRLAFQFLEDRNSTQAITYAELDRAASQIAAGLQQRFKPGSSIALVFPPGLDFVKAFFGCVYAGVYAIPATYPKPRRPSARLSAIVSDAKPAAIMATRNVIDNLADAPSDSVVTEMPWLNIDTLQTNSRSDWQLPLIESSDPAFVQYTSGSTRNPRGVVVSHQNIAANLEMIRTGFELSHAAPKAGVCWLPAYHDMGLIGGILESLYVGGTSVLMSPLSFLQKPVRWLQAISDHRAVVSGGPNFAYELCLRKTKPQDMDGLDLSCWRVAFSGAEPIRSSTMRRFAETFGRYGFSDSSFYPCYGLAEATLFVSGGKGPGKLKTCTVEATALRAHGRVIEASPNDDASAASGTTANTIEIVACGEPLLGEQVLIVDPQTCVPLAENTVGEVWIQGDNVSQGYRNHERETAATFGARLATVTNPVPGESVSESTFLRSGDLGFMRDGSLYITGRQKELLIIRGRNHYPHDFEATVQGSHEKLIPGGGGALLIEDHDDELLVLVQEVDRSATPTQCEAIIPEIRRNVTAEHDVFVHEVLLLRMGTLPRTTSGKVRYAAVNQQYQRGELAIVHRWSFAQDRNDSNQGDAPDSLSDLKTIRGDLKHLLAIPKITDRQMLATEIETRLTTWLTRMSVSGGNRQINEEQFNPHRPFADYGLDSLASMEFIVELEDSLGLKLSPTIAWTYPTPAALSRHLADMIIRRDRTDDDFSEADLVNDSLNDQGDDDEFDELLSQLEAMPDEDVDEILVRENHGEMPE